MKKLKEGEKEMKQRRRRKKNWEDTPLLHQSREAVCILILLASFQKSTCCPPSSLRQTRLTCYLCYLMPHLIDDVKKASASTSLKQFRLTCLLQLHSEMSKKWVATHIRMVHTDPSTNTFKGKRFYTLLEQRVLANAFTHKCFIHKHFYTQTLSLADVFYMQIL